MARPHKFILTFILLLIGLGYSQRKVETDTLKARAAFKIRLSGTWYDRSSFFGYLNGSNQLGLSGIADNAVNSVKIVDASIVNADIVNPNILMQAGDGLFGGGNIFLGGNVLFNVNVDDSTIIIDNDTLKVVGAALPFFISAGGGLTGGGYTAIDDTISLEILVDNRTTQINGDTLKVIISNAGGIGLSPFNNNRYALDFTSANSTLTLKTATFQNSDAEGFISAWIKPETVSASMVVWASANTGAAERAVQGFITSAGAFAIRQRNNDTADQVNTDDGVISAGNQYHIAFGSTDTAYKIWINGVEQSLSVYSGSDNGDWLAATSRVNVEIGAHRGYGGPTTFTPFNGIIDEVSYFNIAPTQAKVDSLFNNGYPQNAAAIDGIIGYWRFEEGTGQWASDTVGTAEMTLGLDAMATSTDPAWVVSPFGWDPTINGLSVNINDSTFAINDSNEVSLKKESITWHKLTTTVRKNTEHIVEVPEYNESAEYNWGSVFFDNNTSSFSRIVGADGDHLKTDTYACFFWYKAAAVLNQYVVRDQYRFFVYDRNSSGNGQIRWGISRNGGAFKTKDYNAIDQSYTLSWHEYGIVSFADSAWLVVDSVKVDTMIVSPNSSWAGVEDSIYIGGADIPGFNLLGWVDEFRLWDTTKTMDYVQAYYRQEPPLDERLKTYLKFDNYRLQHAFIDASGSGNHYRGRNSYFIDGGRKDPYYTDDVPHSKKDIFIDPSFRRPQNISYASRTPGKGWTALADGQRPFIVKDDFLYGTIYDFGGSAHIFRINRNTGKVEKKKLSNQGNSSNDSHLNAKIDLNESTGMIVASGFSQNSDPIYTYGSWDNIPHDAPQLNNPLQIRNWTAGAATYQNIWYTGDNYWLVFFEGDSTSSSQENGTRTFAFVNEDDLGTETAWVGGEFFDLAVTDSVLHVFDIAYYSVSGQNRLGILLNSKTAGNDFSNPHIYLQNFKTLYYAEMRWNAAADSMEIYNISGTKLTMPEDGTSTKVDYHNGLGGLSQTIVRNANSSTPVIIAARDTTAEFLNIVQYKWSGSAWVSQVITTSASAGNWFLQAVEADSIIDLYIASDFVRGLSDAWNPFEDAGYYRIERWRSADYGGTWGQQETVVKCSELDKADGLMMNSLRVEQNGTEVFLMFSKKLGQTETDGTALDSDYGLYDVFIMKGATLQ